MRFIMTIQKPVPDDTCSLEVQEMYFTRATGELTAITKINGSLGEAKEFTSVKEISISLECTEGLIKTAKNITVMTDEELKQEREKYKNHSCFFSSSGEFKNSHIRVDIIRHHVDKKYYQKEEINFRAAIIYGVQEPTQTTLKTLSVISGAALLFGLFAHQLLKKGPTPSLGNTPKLG